MDFGVYTLRDVKTGIFYPPFCAPLGENHAVALRMFVSLMTSRPDVVFAAYPEDFQCFFVGEFSSKTGDLDGFNAGPEFLCNLSDLVSANV